MAIITPSAIVSEIRGSVGNQTFSRNKYRAFSRARNIPANPQTDAQNFVRVNMSAASVAWSFLTDDQRQQWIEWATKINSHARLGSEKPLTGFNMFVKRALASVLDGRDPTEDLIQVWPKSWPVMSIYNVSATQYAFGVEAYEPENVIMCFVYGSDAVSPGKMSSNSVAYKFIGWGFAVNNFQVLDLLSAWETIYAKSLSDQIGKAVFVKFNMMHIQSGVWFTPTYNRIIIA